MIRAIIILQLIESNPGPKGENSKVISSTQVDVPNVFVSTTKCLQIFIDLMDTFKSRIL